MEYIGKVRLDTTHYSGQDLFTDGDIEGEMLNIVQNNTDFTEILAKDNRWPVLYHLSPMRRNLLEWADFERKGHLLEIGAGCGALTGLLCEKVDRVTVVELSKRRAEIIAHRHRERENLRILVGNLNEIPFDEKFDYITLIGVLEYAGSFTETGNPYEDFLKKVGTLLKPGGELVVAIENKFGLKYWAGAPEDHTGNFFEGLEGYPKESRVATFGKVELERLFEAAGFRDCQFYYPYPDYKLPEQIFSDAFLPDAGNFRDFAPNYDRDRVVLFNEKLAFENIVRNDGFPFFANSYLVFVKG